MTTEPNTWKLWAEERPTDTFISYRWRVPACEILGMVLRPEWTDKLHLCGMGYAENEWWPSFSSWDGYRRTLPVGTEWRPALDDEHDIFWGGLDLKVCPFTGRPPKVGYLGRWGGALPYQAEWLSIESFMVNSSGWRDATKMQAAWNKRYNEPEES